MRIFAFLTAIIAMVVPAQAGFVFTIGSVSGNAGTTFIVPVTVTTPDNGQFGPNGQFNLGIDIQPSGVGLQSGITFSPINAPTFPIAGLSGGTLFANPSLNIPAGQLFNIDTLVNSNAASGALLTTNVPSTVFNLRLDVAGSLAPGTYVINFGSNILTSVTDSTGALTLNAAGPGGYTLNNGSITVVPEPSSLALAGLMVVFATGYASRKRFRRTTLAV